MYSLKSVSVAAMGLFVWAAVAVPDASAQRGRGGGRMGGGAMGAAAGRAMPRVGRPFMGGDFRGARFDRRVTNLPYRPYYRSFNRPFYGSFNRPYYRSYARGFYPYYRPYFRSYSPGLSFGFYSGLGYPYRYSYYGYPYRSYYSYPYNYPYNYTYFNDYSSTSHDYSSTTHDYSSTAPYVTAVPGQGYGGIRLKDVPDDAQVFVDGYYVGRAGDFDGSNQRMNLTAGSHRVEIRASGFAPMMFNVNVIPGQTITYNAGMK